MISYRNKCENHLSCMQQTIVDMSKFAEVNLRGQVTAIQPVWKVSAQI